MSETTVNLETNGRCRVAKYWGRKRSIALNRYAVGSQPADRKVARAGTCETPLLSAAFSTALPLTATTERTCWHVSNVPIREVAVFSTGGVSQRPSMAQVHRPRYGEESLFNFKLEHHRMITCYLRYEVRPDKLADFEAYGAMWLDLMPRFGGIHHGYFLPSEGDQL